MACVGPSALWWSLPSPQDPPIFPALRYHPPILLTAALGGTCPGQLQFPKTKSPERKKMQRKGGRLASMGSLEDWVMWLFPLLLSFSERGRESHRLGQDNETQNSLSLGSAPGLLLHTCIQLLFGFSWEKAFGAFWISEWILQCPKLPQKNTAALSTRKDPFDTSSELSIHLFIQPLNTYIKLLLYAGLHLWLG